MSEENKNDTSEQELSAEQLEEVAGGSYSFGASKDRGLKLDQVDSLITEIGFPAITAKKPGKP